MNPEDRAAFADARIAAVHAGLKLNADQEKLWPPVETAVRDFAKIADRSRQCADERASQNEDAQKPDDPVARLRERADHMATSAAAMKKIADAADPLYKTLDDGQKRRLAILTHMEGRFGGGWRHRGFEHGMMGGDRDQWTTWTTWSIWTAAIGTAAGSSRVPCQSRRNSRKSRRIPAAFSDV